MKLIRGTPKGFFANCNDAARHISRSLQTNKKWYIQWGNETPYYDINHGSNVWEYYFEQIHKCEDITETVSDCVDLVHINNSSFRDTMHYIYSNYFILNQKIISILETHFDYFNNHNVLGVHIRRTDKFLVGFHGATHAITPVDLDIFKQEIDKVEKEYDTIFLATDCQDACDFIKTTYGKKVIFNKNCLRSKGVASVHENYKYVSGYTKGIDVLSDVLLLSKCKHLIRSSSNVSITALYINPHLTQLNLNDKYLGDTETRDFL